MTAIVTDIKAVLPRNYFWDVDSSKLDAQANKMFIVNRVFMNITPAEVSTILPVLLKYYSSKDIYETLSQSEEFLRLNMKAVNVFCV